MAQHNPKLVTVHNNLVKMYKGLAIRGKADPASKALASKVGENLKVVRHEMGLPPTGKKAK